MPDLTGLTMREAMRRFEGTELSLKFRGTGRVVSHVPLPGTPLRGVSRVVVEFDDSTVPGG